ncbi:MAG: SPOR domain-containing protein [Bacteroidia bacterium]|nr:SPOR domain-containing protein [Bacteroidia bacterium]
MKSNLSLFSFLLIALGCAAQKSNSSKTHYEDLSLVRPKFALPTDSIRKSENTEVKPLVTPTKNVNAKVDFVLDSIDRLNGMRKFIEGYTIQIYSGQNREEANNAKKKMANEVTGLSASLQYIQPKFRVRVGNYFSKLEAQKDLTLLKPHFPNAILIPEKIPIR